MRRNNQKLKLLYLSKIMQEQTDDTHSLSMSQIIAELAKYDIDAQRKSIYDDLDALDDFGIEIFRDKDGFRTYYHCGNRALEIEELKMIVDAIQSSNNISEEKAKELIKKLDKSVSPYDSQVLDREVKVTGRVRNMNESVFSAVNVIHAAMKENKAIQFKFFSWNVAGEEEFHRDGAFYNVSPWELRFEEGRYYFIGYDHDKKEMSSFRVDKVRDVSVIDKKRRGKTEFNKQNKAKKNELYFRMCDGAPETVTLKCKNEMADVIIDKFGKDVKLIPEGDENFTVSINVVVCSQFLSWVIGLEGKVTVNKPDSVKLRMIELLKNNI